MTFPEDPYKIESDTPDYSHEFSLPRVSYDGALRPVSTDDRTPQAGGDTNPGGGWGVPIAPSLTFGGPELPTGPALPKDQGQIGVGTGYQYQNPGFDDPATKQFFDLMSQLVAKLTSPINDPSGDQFKGILNDSLTRTTGDTNTYQSQLDEEIRKSLLPVFGTPELASLRTNAFDTLNSQRQADIANTVRQLAQRGVSPRSPLVQSAIADVNRRWDTQEAQQRQGLNTFELGQQAGRPAQTAALEGQRFGAGQTQVGTATNIGQVLNALAAAKRAEELANYSKALGLTSSGVDLTEGRLKDATGALGGLSTSGDLGSVISAILGLTNATNNQNQVAGQNNAAWFAQLGQLLAGLNKPKTAAA